MGRKIKSYTLSDITINRLERFADANNISKSRAIEKILDRFLLIESPALINPADIPYEKPPVVEHHTQTIAEHLEEWEWRKNMVKQGKFPVHMADEYPILEYPNRKDVYLTTDGNVLAADGSNANSQEDKDFEESLKTSLAEKE